MRSPLRLAFAVIAAGAGLAACTDRPSEPTAPNTPARVNIPGVSSSVSVRLDACDPNQIKADGRAFSAKNSDVLQSYLGDLANLFRSLGIGAATTDKSFDALSRIAQMRGTPDQNSSITAAVFDRLVRGLLACTTAATTAGAPVLGDGGFGPALGPNWAFEVRGKASLPADPTGPAFERGSTDGTWWVFDKNAATWTAAISSNWAPQRVFIYGYRTDFLGNYTRVGGSSFEHRTIPKTVKPTGSNPYFTVAAIVGLCLNDGAVITSTQRVNHAGNFLAEAGYGACSSPPAFTPVSPLASASFSPRALASRALGFFAPRSLYAATLFAGGSVTGSPDDFSPSAVYDLSGLALGTPDSIGDGMISAPIHRVASTDPVRVPVTVVNSTQAAPDGTPVTVSIVGNSSSIAFFADGSPTATPSVTVTRYSLNGYATFDNVYLTKAGGYQLAFQITSPPPFVAVGPLVAAPNSFQMQNK